MTIKPGEEWGTEVDRPDDLLVVADDAALADAIERREPRPLGLGGGDLFRTVGARPLADRSVVRALPLDVMRVQTDHDELLAVAHLAIRAPRRRGGWWRGPVTLVMNVEFLGDWDVAVRGHPNDGRVERFDLRSTTSLRQRRAIAQRLRNGSHLPHPAIDRTVGRSHEIAFDRPMRIAVDGRDRGVTRRVTVSVDADATTVFA